MTRPVIELETVKLDDDWIGHLPGRADDLALCGTRVHPGVLKIPPLVDGYPMDFCTACADVAMGSN